MVGHAGDVVADNLMTGLALSQIGVVARHSVGVVEIKAEKCIERGYGTVAILHYRWIRIKVFVEELF